MRPIDLSRPDVRVFAVLGWVGVTILLGTVAVLVDDDVVWLGWTVLVAWVVLSGVGVLVLYRAARRRAQAEVAARERRARNARNERAAQQAAKAEQAAVDAARTAAEREGAELSRAVPMRDLSTTAARRSVVSHWSRANPRSIQRFGAKNRSMWAAEVLAFRASRGRYGLDALDRAVLAAAKGAPEAFDPGTLLTLARLLAAFETEPQTRIAQRILRYLSGPAGASLSAEARHVATELLLLGGDETSAERIVQRTANPDYRHFLHRADLANPFLPGHEDLSMQSWLDLFNLTYTDHALEPVRLSAEGATPFDRLDSVPSDRVADGPLVTVIMTCFRPDDGMITAIRSMIRQSWRTWELLVIDDGSGPGYDAVLAQAAAMDRRVRVIRSAENRGTYFQRNEGIRRAFGEYVTMHDSDDWAHPRRLEIQVRHLEAHPDLVGNVTSSLRVTNDLAFVQPRSASLRLTETSLLFRRRTVVDRVGYYDDVRKGADSEFRLRIESAFGSRVPLLELPVPLMLVRYSRTSLTGSDFGDGWVHSARVAYKSGWMRWHEQIAAGEAAPRIEHPMASRPYPANEYIQGVPVPERTLDVVVVSDYRPGANTAGTLERLVEDLDHLAASRTVGIAQIDSVSTCKDAALLPARLQDLVNEGRIVQLHDADRATASTVVVTAASMLTGLPSESRNIRAERTILVEDVESARDLVNVTYVRVDSVAVAAAAFGPDPELRSPNPDGLSALVDETTEDTPEVPTEQPTSASLDDVAPVHGSFAEPTSFAALPETQLELVNRALGLPQNATIVELGSGHSTVRLAAAIAQSRPDLRLVSLDHDAHYAGETRRMLADAGVADQATVVDAPLERFDFDGEAFPWYSRGAWESIQSIDLLFVDGPPASVRIHSRWPAVPLLGGRLSDGAILAVDDADRPDERSVIDDWQERAALTSAGTAGRTAFFHCGTATE
ncbi:hypothetical protein GCM10017714_12000 [Curtobacterium pusillum]|nr:hypothetical protein GCM10017610_07450 [Curtobacterium pusillum]